MNATFRLTMPIARLINSNHREHWAPRAEKRREMRLRARSACTDLPKFPGPVHLDVVFQFPDNRERDVDNYEVKGAIDGIVDAGVITDDNSKRLVGVNRRASNTRAPKGYAVLTFILTDQEVPF